MRFRNPHVFMGKGDDQREYIRRVLDGAGITEQAERLRRRLSL